LKNITGTEIDDGDSTTFTTLETDIRDNYSGWYRNFATSGERNLGQATILGDIITFSTFIPNNDPCSYEGASNLYGLYYKTGTAYWKGVLITDDYPSGIDGNDKVVYKINVGKGYSTTPNLHTGEDEGSKSFLQTSTGAIIGIKHANPGITKSGGIYWREVL
jgi:type IV pilus assembly protein PilY1